MKLEKATCPGCNAVINPTSKECEYCNTVFLPTKTNIAPVPPQPLQSAPPQSPSPIQKSVRKESAINIRDRIVLVGVAVFVFILALNFLIIPAISASAAAKNYVEEPIISTDFTIKHWHLAETMYHVHIETKGIFTDFDYIVRLHTITGGVVATKTNKISTREIGTFSAAAFFRNEIQLPQGLSLQSNIAQATIEIIGGTVSVHKDSYVLSTGGRSWVKNQSPYRNK